MRGIPRELITVVGLLLGAAGLVAQDHDPCQDQIDHVHIPTVTARDVVDRATLKTFVTEAGQFYVNSLIGDIETTKCLLRDPYGPWRRDSVYLYVWDLTSDTIEFHGAFPERYEGNSISLFARDDVAETWILTMVREAAASSPEGGFLEYHFDDPTDQTNRSYTPKLGFAREFMVMIESRQKTVLVGSGFYLQTTG